MTRRELSVLVAQLRSELEKLELTTGKVASFWSASEREGRTEEKLAALAMHLHGFYGGAEKLFETVARNVDESVPSGPSSHRDLVAQMSIEIPGLRPRVISQSLASELRPYLEFRHRVRHLYLFDLAWSDVDVIAPALAGCWRRFCEEMESFVSFLEGVDSPARS